MWLAFAEVLIPVSANPVDFDALYEAGIFCLWVIGFLSLAYVDGLTLPTFLTGGWLLVRDIPQKESVLAICSLTLRRSYLVPWEQC